MEIDPKFRQARQRSRNRRRSRLYQQIAIFGGGAFATLLLAAALTWLFWGDDHTADPGVAPAELAATDGSADVEGEFVQVETETTAPPIRVATPFVDIAGDPMILHFETDASSASHKFAGPPTLDAARIGNPSPERLQLVSDDLIVQESRLITALPSSREDFAFFQAQRSQSLNTAIPSQTEPEIDPDAPATEISVTGDSDDSWGASLSTSESSEVVTYAQTKIENTTSIAYVRPEAQRERLYKDIVVRIELTRSLTDVMESNGFTSEAATEFATSAAKLIPIVSELPTGVIVALRTRSANGVPIPLQMSVYGGQGYIASIARIGPNNYALSSDPWIDDDLPKLASPNVNVATTTGQDFRLLDAFYSAAIRNGVPTSLVGESIVMMSQAFDLEAFASPGDKMTLLYAPTPGRVGPGPSQILYAGINGPSGEMKCYVVSEGSSDSGSSYSCFNQRRGSAAPSGGLGDGLIAPVNAPISSTFGPRFHPILKEVRLHAGVDWAAPTGTEVHAAGAGRISRADRSDSYGNVIYIDHPNGFQTRYAHLDHFAPGISAGVDVTQGQLIGFVGTTGRSTGPHLHFELHDTSGAPVDPLNMPTAPGGGGGAVLAASDAVEALTDQIIHVESGGNASARNPLSSATGLGQFIESTWLRMMRDYRPDLATTMSRADLLALRTDPTLSREMVQNLARENETFLRARGNTITVGRLYLAHFLGPAGAATVLAANDDQKILDVMGQGVVTANPFLRDFTVADLKAWADRKMNSTGSSPAPAAPIVISPEVMAYMQVIDEILVAEG
jgi:murein DD-endopeptidase MepM/ murein hydrolase activator NlpD